MIDEAISHRADSILLEFGRENVAKRYQVDGVWIESPGQPRAAVDPTLEVFKVVIGANPAERRARQAGQFIVDTRGKKYDARFMSQGTEGGERAVIHFEGTKHAFKSLEELGMRAKTQEILLQHVRRPQGFILVSSMPANGFTTTFDLMLLATDRFVRNFVAIEDSAKPEREIENVTVVPYTSGTSPKSILPGIIRTYPDVFVMRDLVDGETVSILCEQVSEENRMVLGGIRAKEAVEALLRVLLLKAPQAEFAGTITAVLNVRLIRKLCESCKEAYPPSPDLLKRLGLPQGKIAAFYRVPVDTPEKKRPMCPTCGNIGYFGRTGLFELLIVDDAMRNILIKSPKIELLREAARRAKHHSLQEEGVLLVARGVTSLEELSRVLKN